MTAVPLSPTVATRGDHRAVAASMIDRSALALAAALTALVQARADRRARRSAPGLRITQEAAAESQAVRAARHALGLHPR